MAVQLCKIVSPQKNERPVKLLVKYMIDIAMGMHYISERGLVHRVSDPCWRGRKEDVDV